MSSSYPGYLELLDGGELARRVEEAVRSLADCVGCARECHVDRLHQPEPESYCRGGRYARVSSCFPHHGEESCLRGQGGSGTIFFSHCNLRCVFCQNFDVSWQAQGRLVVADELARMMLSLQDHGCHNVNFVTPSHVVPQILEALVIAAERGLKLPIVYNTGGYDSLRTLRWLDGVVDVYMPDFKFWDTAVSRELANAADYRQVACAAIKEMHRQVGDLVIDEAGIARRGLLVRHLVMPDGRAGTEQVMRFLAEEISPDTFVNIMPQYRPAGHAGRHESIDRPITLTKFHDAVAAARQQGLWRFDK